MNKDINVELPCEVVVYPPCLGACWKMGKEARHSPINMTWNATYRATPQIQLGIPSWSPETYVPR